MGIDDHNREDGHIGDCKGVGRMVLRMACCSLCSVYMTKCMALRMGHSVLHTFQNIENGCNVVRNAFHTNRNPHQNDTSERIGESKS